MFKVNCPGCEAPYQVDERRVPSDGLKMRCPKCGTSFQVEAPEPAKAEAIVPKPALAAPPSRTAKATMLGVAPGAPLPAPRKPPPIAPRPALPAPDEPLDVASILPEEDDEAPAVPALKPPPVPRTLRANAASALSVPSEPAPGAPSPPVVGPPDPATGSVGTELDLDLPLPAPMKANAVLGIQPKPEASSFDNESPWANDGDDAAALPDLRLSNPPPRKGRPPLDTLELDLPGVPAKMPSAGWVVPSGFAEIELDDAPLPDLRGAPRSLPGELDLPSPTSHLPIQRADLPTPARGNLPSLSGSNDHLPSPLAGVPSPIDSLPSPFGAPSPAGHSGDSLPRALDALPDFGELPSLSNRPPPISPRAQSRDSQVPSGGSQPPDAGSLLFGGTATGFDSGPPRAALSQPPFGSSPGELRPHTPIPPHLRDGPEAFGEVSLGGSVPPESGGASMGGARASQALGGIELDNSKVSVPPENLSVFSRAPAASHVPPHNRSLRPQGAPTRRLRGVKLAAIVLVPLFVGGGALTFVPEIGPFGYNFASDWLHRGAHQELLDKTIKEARQAMAEDTFLDGQKAFELLRTVQKEAPREKSFVAYAVFVGFMQKLRFEKVPEIQAKSEVMLTELNESPAVRYADLAKVAAAGANENLARPLNQLRELEKTRPNDIDVLVLSAEMALRARPDPDFAVKAWERAKVAEHSPRTEFGLARARRNAGDSEGAMALAEAVLKLNPAHQGAKLMLAELTWETRGDESAAGQWLDRVIKERSLASAAELTQAYTLLGDIQAARSRVTQAQAAYEQALKVDPQAAGALVGLGNTLQQAGRHAEALARFEASNQIEADNLKALLGIAGCKLRLERLNEAHADLVKLRARHPKEPEVAYWLGRAEEARGQREAAEKSYRDAIQLSDKRLRSVGAVGAHVALVTLLNQQGRSSEAQKVLEEAKKNLPASPGVHQSFGDLAQGQGAYELALQEYKAALALDPEDIGVKFSMGVTLRRMRRFDEAKKAFAEVEQADSDHPGLSLERGLLSEEAGRPDEAMAAYEQALKNAPNDLDMLLRVGCFKAAAGRGKEAALLLRKVLEERPQSAESNYCLGRALLAEGNNLTDAQRMLQRAVEIDPNRADFHLYLGWVAAEVGQMDKAKVSFNRAIELDKGFGDAYWRRGILAARQGAVKDAVVDFNQALKLRPNLWDVHAALADAYYDLGMESEALSHWAEAVLGKPNEAVWQFRYGRLLVSNRREVEARDPLQKAIKMAEQEEPRPRWLWEAHHMLARALGSAPEAADHWEQYLRLSPADSPYRREAISVLAKFGRPWHDAN